MIENKNDASRNLEKALQALEQAKQRVANEKKKQNEKKRKAEKPLPHRGDCQRFRAKGQTGLADCQRKTPKKNIRQNRFAVSR